MRTNWPPLFRCLALAVSSGLSCGSAPHAAAPPPKVVELPPSNPVAIGKMVQGVHAANDGQRESAVTYFRAAIALDASLWEARYDLGVVLANGGDLAGAETELALCAKVSPDAQDVAVGLAEVRRRRGEQKLAAEGLSAFVNDHPGAVAARTLYVSVLRESGQLDKAMAQAGEVLVRKPADAAALAELSLAHLAKGEKESAALLAKQAVDANPGSAVAHRATGLLALANGDDAGAFAEFRKAAQADPHDTTSRLNMGVVLLHAGAYAKAEEQYRETLKVSPDDSDAKIGLAAALRGESDPAEPQKLEEARSILEQVLALDPHDTSALFNLGILYADFLKKPAASLPYFKRFLSDAPGDDPLRTEADKYAAAAASAPPAPAPSAPPAAPPPSTNSPKGPLANTANAGRKK